MSMNKKLFLLLSCTILLLSKNNVAKASLKINYIESDVIINANEDNTNILTSSSQNNDTISILKQPEDWTGAENTRAYFNVVVDETDNLTYQWQQSGNNGDTWYDVNAATDASYQTVISSSNNGRIYRCMICDSNGNTIYTDSAKLSISEEFEIIKQPETFKGNIGENANIYIQVGGTNITYQWQQSTDGVDGWINVSTTAIFPRMVQTNRPYIAGYYYRCVVTDGEGNELISNTAQILCNETGFVTYDGYTYYIQENSAKAVGLQEIDESIYYFGSNGIMRTGFCTVDGEKYYFSKETGAAVIGWLEGEDTYLKYYFDSDGTAHTGWLTVDEKTYYFYSTGYMAYGITLIDGTHYYFDVSTGEQKTGFIEVGLKNYMYFSSSTGEATGGLITIDGNLYYFSEEEESYGVADTGLQSVEGKTYYFDSSTKQAVKGFVTEDKYTYYMGEDYTMLVGLQKIDGYLYYFDSNGRLTTGFQHLDDGYYYFDLETGTAISGWHTSNTGDMYYFDSETLKAVSGIQVIDGEYYYFSQSCRLTTGLVSVDGKYYYFPEEENAGEGFYTVGNRTFYMDESHQLLTGVQMIDGKMYYFNDSGYMLTGMYEIDNVRFYFDNITGEAVTGFVSTASGYTYYFDGANGGLSGLQTIEGNLYYLSTKSLVQYGKYLIDGYYYYFDYQTGAAVKGWWCYTTTDGLAYMFYYDPVSYHAVTGLQEIDGDLYYFNQEGYIATGYKTVDGTKYYFDKATGAAYFGTLSTDANTWKTINDVIYYYDASGEPITGLRVIDYKLYYFDDSGAMVTGLVNVEGNTYYMTAEGCLSGIQKIEGNTYYFNTRDCTAIKDCIRYVDGNVYVFDENGKQKYGWIEIYNGCVIYIDDSGSLLTGLQEIDGCIFWFGTGYTRKTGIQTVEDADGNTYIWYFDQDGINQRGLITYGGYLYYFNEETGTQETGWVTVEGEEYYFSLSSGRAVSGLQSIEDGYYYFNTKTFCRELGFVKVGERLYYFTDESDTGVLQGLVELNGKWYAFANSGYVRTGILNIDGVWYYFDTETGESVSGIYWNGTSYALAFVSGGGYETGLVEYEGKTFYFYPRSGKMAVGLVSIGDTLYYFDADEGMLKNTTVKVGNITYQIDENGAATATGSSLLVKMINSGIDKLGIPYGSDYIYNDFYVEEDEREDSEYYSCSTFVKAILEDVGIEAVKSVWQQYFALIEDGYSIELIEDLNEAMPGDIIYMINVNCPYAEDGCVFCNEIHHVMVYMGEGKVMHSAYVEGDDIRIGVQIEDWSENNHNFAYVIVRLTDLYTALDAAIDNLTIGIRTVKQLVYDETFSGDISLAIDTGELGDKVLLLELVTDEETGGSEFKLLDSSLIDEEGNYSFTVSNYSEGVLVFGYNGDVNGDEEVTAADTLAILRYVSNREIPDVIELGFADVDMNGVVSSSDLLTVLNYVSGRISALN